MPDKPTPAELLEWLLEAEEMDEPTFAEWLAEQSNRAKADGRTP
jgi:hypothetical protein